MNKNINKCEEYLVKVNQALNTFNNYYGDVLPYEIKRTVEYAKGLFTLCPIQPGDTVEFVDPPIIGKGSGWHCSRHLFVKDNRAKAKYTDWDSKLGVFTVSIEFEKETWINPITGEEAPVSRPHLFMGIKASRFKKVDKVPFLNFGCHQED